MNWLTLGGVSQPMFNLCPARAQLRPGPAVADPLVEYIVRSPIETDGPKRPEFASRLSHALRAVVAQLYEARERRSREAGQLPWLRFESDAKGWRV